MMKAILLAASVTVLTACASGGPIATGNGGYYLTKKSAGCGFSGGEGSKAALLREANEFCAKQGGAMVVTDAVAHNGIPFAHCASAELQFRCTTRP